MKGEVRIGVVGDFKPGYRGHAKTEEALGHAARALGVKLDPAWLSTVEIETAVTERALEAYDGFFLTPGTPYQSQAGALRTLRFARERGWPLLATCGGFQHLLLEVAINAAGITDGQHGDYGTTGGTPVIVRVACPVADRAPGAAALSGRIRLTLRQPSQVFQLYGRGEIEEEFACNWELRSDLQPVLEKVGLRMVGFDGAGLVRVAEIADHPFFLGTLFQPQLSSTEAAPHPVIHAFCAAAQRFERPR
jgi:CTP synthase (UTP-ammonia lyase)